MTDDYNSDRITLEELMVSLSTMSEALSVKTKKALVRSASIANDAEAAHKAIATKKYTEILFRTPVSRVVKTRWRFETFRGSGGGVTGGIVDAIGMRKDTRKSKDDTSTPSSRRKRLNLDNAGCITVRWS